MGIKIVNMKLGFSIEREDLHILCKFERSIFCIYNENVVWKSHVVVPTFNYVLYDVR